MPIEQLGEVTCTQGEEPCQSGKSEKLCGLPRQRDFGRGPGRLFKGDFTTRGRMNRHNAQTTKETRMPRTSVDSISAIVVMGQDSRCAGSEREGWFGAFLYRNSVDVLRI